MADDLIDLIAAALGGPGLKAQRIRLAELAVEGAWAEYQSAQEAEEPGMSDRDLFEAWLMERWERDMRSPEFRASAQYEVLRAEWEREN